MSIFQRKFDFDTTSTKIFLHLCMNGCRDVSRIMRTNECNYVTNVTLLTLTLTK